MYCAKATFFDAQANAGWAADEYGDDELKKLDLLFSETGDLSGKTILEPGCGTGRLTELLSEKTGKNGKVVALDISPAMVEAAKERFKKKEFNNEAAKKRLKENAFNNVELFVAKIESFEAEPSTFDLILCHQVFPHIEDKALALKHFYHLLAPDGKVIVFHFIDFDEINNVHRKAGTVVEKDMMPEQPEMEKLFNEAGFTIKFIRNNENGYFLTADKKPI